METHEPILNVRAPAPTRSMRVRDCYQSATTLTHRGERR